jgi:lysophospholipase L1-like esterase
MVMRWHWMAEPLNRLALRQPRRSPMSLPARKHPVLREVLAQEVEVDQRVRSFLQQRGISYIDLLPPLRDAVSHTRIYRLDEDGHPTAGGYSVIAREVASAIAQH